MLVAALITLVTSLQAPAVFAQEQNQQRDPNEGQPKHAINELQNRLHQTEDKNKELTLRMGFKPDIGQPHPP
jgi:hypothetical protein